MEARNQRMLEEVLKLPGNDNCADCHAPAPRWASVNLGIFLCVGCASIHRKMGTHKSRVKSVTLDTWSRDQITNMKTIGNINSNATWNPNEALHPPPATFVAEERDSEIERYIRKKYEQGAFRGGAAARLDGRPEPTSLNRARERDGRLPPGAMGGGLGRENMRNPELNDIVMPRRKEERDLPPLPPGSGNRSPAPPRARPVRSSSSQNMGSPWSSAPSGSASALITQAPAHTLTDTSLIDISGPSTSSTLPLQVNMSGSTSTSGSSSNGYLSAQPTFSTSPAPPQINGFSSSPNQFGNGMMNGFSTSPQATMGMGMGVGNGFVGMYGQQLSPQSTYGGQLPNQGQGQQISPQQSYGQQLSPQPMYNQQVQISPQMQGYSAFSHPQSQSGATSAATPSPSFMSSGTFGSSPAIQTPQGYASSSHSPSFMPQQLQQQFQPQQQQQQQFGQQRQQQFQNGMGYGQAYAAPKPPDQFSQVYGGAAGYGYGQQQMGMGVNMNMGR
ncbi:hypothetical protein I316_04665 [Kwoniella heveanensis BCC8398]|uniref:Arf-GAP domain-containing protein n=1 Tax=Kwoniella heveanensis BCC8398 TaxID=1296120 RepID=A0A1B9GRA4_9TREE|nr:hypothetical protein I316_04665 [Kwoniella heveanensis BCC8398]